MKACCIVPFLDKNKQSPRHRTRSSSSNVKDEQKAERSLRKCRKGKPQKKVLNDDSKEMTETKGQFILITSHHSTISPWSI